ncbi:MAG: hypothetical protein JRE64_11855 [Deltaproteobacteria bacterium]|nr:hypothetical protein [Deltaproteobacteria bacterium]
MAQTTNQQKPTAVESNTATFASAGASAQSPTTQQGTLQKIEKTTSEKVITSSDWLSVSVTLWPIVAAIVLVIFRKQVASLLQDLAGFTFGSFALKLRCRVSKVAQADQLEKIRSLSAYDLKFFFVMASQSWKIKKVDWSFDVHENLKLHEKLEQVGLVVIKNKDSALIDNKVNALLTPFGEELYQELTSLISESLR